MRASNAHATFVDLLDRYPRVNSPELELLVAIYPRLSALDIALMLSDEGLSSKLDAFSRDHASRIRTPFRQYAVLVAIAVAGALLLLWSLVLTK